jgi:predicted dehydrogenase
VARIGIIGLGYWGPNYARVLHELGAAPLVVACDARPEALDLLRTRYPDVRLTTDADDVLADPSVDAVIVATPTSTHAELTLAALRAGKHVLCEKPLAFTVAECDRAIEAAERAGRVLMVGHTFIFNPAVRRMKALIDEGAVGSIRYCHAARTGLGPIRQDVNALWDLAPHDVSIILHLFEREPVEVVAFGESYLLEGTEDVVFVTLRLEDHILANIHLSWIDPYKTRRLTVIGEQRMLVFDDVVADEKLRLYDRGASYEASAEQARGAEYGEYKAIVRDGDILIPKVAPTEPLKEQTAHFLRCCDDGLEPETDGAAGRRVVAVLAAAAASLEAGGEVVAIPPVGHERVP